jgi:nucleotide-binding universal stress UspA family protein
MMAQASKPGLERILVSVDFGDPSIVAARWTAEFFAPDAEIILAHIIEPPPATRSNVMRFPSVETIVTKAHVDVEHRLQEMCRSLNPARARAEIRVGVPHDELVQLAITTGADMIVIGRQDLTSSGWARIGTTAQRILRKSKVPILLVAGPAPHAPEHVLVAIDESSSTDDVLRWGSFVSHRFSAKATVVHAASVDDPPEEDTWVTTEIKKVSGSATMDQRITRSSIRPAESIIDEARALRTELIVIGSRGAGAADQMLFGSVAESVLLASPCPVLVVLPTP